MTNILHTELLPKGGKKVTVNDTIVSYYNADGELHREDGPAMISPEGTQWWMMNGKVHRVNGPAIIYQDGEYEFVYNDLVATRFVNKRIKELGLTQETMDEEDYMAIYTEYLIQQKKS